MAKRGHEINLASGVMFSPAQENKRMQKARIVLVKDLTIQHMATLGVRVEYFKQPSMIHEFHFYDGEERFARRSLDGGTIRKGARKASCDMMKSVCDDYGIAFDWNDVPETAEPQERVIVDTVGAPPETQYQERVVIEQAPEETDSAAELPDVLNDVDRFNQNMTIAQLRAWGRSNGIPVPSTLSRKGDILGFLANEYSNRG